MSTLEMIQKSTSKTL